MKFPTIWPQILTAKKYNRNHLHWKKVEYKDIIIDCI